MTDTNQNDDTIITVKLQKGLADRHRLPLVDVLRVLDEFRLMVTEVGRRIQRERGVPNPSGDFGLEVVAGQSGLIFQKGSIQAPLAITSNIQTGLQAAQEVVSALGMLEQENGVPEPNQELDRSLLRRISKVAKIQKRDRMELQVSIQRPGFPAAMTATFGTAGIDSVTALQVPTFEVHGVSMYGKLIELVDHDPADEDGKGFWGELRREDGEVWRVQFRNSETEGVTRLFRKQVVVTGRAVYYRVQTPKIVAETIASDDDRDYEAAFDELYGTQKAIFNADLKTLLRRMREDE